ncbi:MAG: hypothetical protein ACTHJ0_15055 [Flavipsychrobacter sp.]
MRKILPTIIIALCYLQLHAQQGYIKFDLNDCFLCQYGIRNTQSLNFPISLVIKESLKEDSAAIEKKYLLSAYHYPIIWSDSLYDHLNKQAFSEFIIYDQSNKEIFRGVLKGLDSSKIRLALETSVAKGNTSSSEEILCHFYLPPRFNIDYVNNTQFFIENNLNNEYYELHNNGAEIDTFSLSYDLAKQTIIKGKLQNPESWKYYTTLRPVFSAAYKANAKTNYLLGTCYDIVPVAEGSQDSVANKVLFIYKYSGNKLMDIYSIDKTEAAVNENAFFISPKGDLYMTTVKPNDGKNYYLAKFELNDRHYRFSNYVNDTLPPQYSTTGIKYNMVAPRVAYPFFTLPFSNRFVNLENNKTYTIPFDDSVFKGMAEIMNFNRKNKLLPYAIWNVRYDKATGNLLIIYAIYDDLKFMVYNPAQQRIIKDRKLMDLMALKATPTIDESLKFAYYYMKDKHCIYRIPLDY